MSFKRYFSYIRVSTQRQGQSGTSLGEQKAAIERYAAGWNLKIVRQFEEQETAAKAGRPVFLEMLRALKKGEAEGVVIHKIDRSARNLKDWADLGSLIDAGVEVHFANEAIDLNSRGGRLSADIQAVVAADYIRNLREEVKKGFYGRIKQGLYPMPAPVGYIDSGKGQPKQLDPVQAPLVKSAFELYATGSRSLNSLVAELYDRGLRNKRSGRVSRNGLSNILRNRFYTGLIHLKGSGELFAGRHEAMVSPALFDRVQAVLAGKCVKKQQIRFFVFRKHIRCGACNHFLIPEMQKGYAYYRCQTLQCPARQTLREDRIEKQLEQFFEELHLNKKENAFFKAQINRFEKKADRGAEQAEKHLRLRLEQTKTRLSKLAEAYLDEVFDRRTYLENKNALLKEEQKINEKIAGLESYSDVVRQRMQAFLELLNSAHLSYKWGNPGEKRDLVQTVTSNFVREEKTVLFKPHLPFQLIAERSSCPAGGAKRAATRTLKPIFEKLIDYFQENDLVISKAFGHQDRIDLKDFTSD